MSDCGKWLSYCHDFIHLVHPKYGYYVNYPCEGGYFNQPYRLMNIYDTIKIQYMDLINEQQKKM